MRLGWNCWLWLACVGASVAFARPASATTSTAGIGVTIVSAPVRAASEIDLSSLARLREGIDDGALRARVVALSTVPASNEPQRLTVEFN